MMCARRNADCSIIVHGETFNCRRHDIQLASTPLRGLLENAAPDYPVELEVPEVTARSFEYVLRFAYRRPVELDAGVVGEVMAVADALSMPRLRAECVSYMTRTLSPDTCLRYWSHLESYDVSANAEQSLYRRCREVACSTFWRAADSPRLLAGASDAIVEMLLRDYGLQVYNII